MTEQTNAQYENRQLTTEEKTKLSAMIKDGSNLLFQSETIREQVGDIRKLAKEEFGLMPKEFNVLLRMYHKDQRDKIEEESMGAIDLYDSIFNKQTDDN